MLKMEMIKSIIKEYGIDWVINRIFYSLKLRMLRLFPFTNVLFEKRTSYPTKINLFDIDIDALKYILSSLDDEEEKKLIVVADNAAKGIIEGFSAIDLDYGITIDWHYNPITRERCDEKIPWYKIADFDEKRGDIKVIWEASRFSHFLTFARAYLLFGDVKYYQSFSKQLNDWLNKNVYGYGANFKCGQECSIRMINALLAFTVFDKSGLTTDADRSNIMDLIDRCYRKILSNFFYAHKCIRNNHTISELVGMLIGAWCCGEDNRLDKAIKLLDETIDEQFMNDGGYRQFSFNYQRLALQDLECVLSIEKRIGKKLSEHSKNKIKKAAMLLYQCQENSGDVPNYGANDGALVFPVYSGGYRDFKSVINTSYALVTGEQVYKPGKHQEELVWFSNGKKLSEYRQRRILRISSQFPDAGLFTIRRDRFWAMIILNDYKSRPAHMDQLHFDLWIDGVNVFCDLGTYSYATDLGRKLTKNESHNTADIAGVAQMNSYGPFMIYDWTKCKDVISDDVHFRGTMVSSNGYEHTRKIDKTDSGFRIKDKITEVIEKKRRICFHTPCDVKLNEKHAWLLQGGKKICEIKSNKEIHMEVSERSVYYLHKEKISCLYLVAENEEDIDTEIII